MPKLNYKNLESLPEWQHLKAKLTRMVVDYEEDLLRYAEAGNVNIVLNRSGRISMILDILRMPKEDMPGDKHADAEE